MANLLQTPPVIELAVIRARSMSEAAAPAQKPGRRNVSQEEVLDYLSPHEEPVMATTIARDLMADEEWLRVRLRRMVQDGILQPHSVRRNGRLAYSIKKKSKGNRS